MTRWCRFDRMPLRIDGYIAAEVYVVYGFADDNSHLRHYGASTHTEAQSIAQRLRKDERMQFVGIYRVEEAWKRCEQ